MDADPHLPDRHANLWSASRLLPRHRCHFSRTRSLYEHEGKRDSCQREEKHSQSRASPRSARGSHPQFEIQNPTKIHHYFPWS
jgi:hypothetical protein